jgi:hypothetical protein
VVGWPTRAVFRFEMLLPSGLGIRGRLRLDGEGRFHFVLHPDQPNRTDLVVSFHEETDVVSHDRLRLSDITHALHTHHLTRWVSWGYGWFPSTACCHSFIRASGWDRMGSGMLVGMVIILHIH